MSSPLTRRIVAEYEGTAAAQSGAASASRRAALALLENQGLPSTRDENWKYANLRSLERQRFVPPPPTADVSPAAAGVPAALPGYRRYVFVDGVFASTLSAAPAGAFTSGDVAGEATGADERFALLNQAFATDGASIRVAAADAPTCIELVFVALADAAAGASYPRVALELAPGARATLIERHVSASQVANFVNIAVAVRIGHGGQLEHLRLQDLNARSTLFDTLSAELAAAASYRLHAITTGARASRSTLTVRLRGRQAQFSLAAASLGDAQQLQDTYCVVEHLEPDARTLQTFRGIAAGRARVAFNAKVVVAKGARGTDSRQSLRGLLAGPEAEIDVRPQLEIYTDDVRCSHGATAGKLDDTMLFYLLSRGLSREAAQRLLKWAFLEDVIAQITLPALRRQIEERIAAQLRDETLQELL